MSASEGITSQLASSLRALSDEDLVLAAGPWIQDRIRSAISTSPGSREIIGRALDGAKKGKAVKVAIGAPPAAKRRMAAPPLPKPAPSRGAPRRVAAPPAGKRPPGGADGDKEIVFRQLAGSDEPLSPRELVQRTGLRPTLVKMALYKLRREGRAQLEGRATSAKWSVAA